MACADDIYPSDIEKQAVFGANKAKNLLAPLLRAGKPNVRNESVYKPITIHATKGTITSYVASVEGK
jgi:hypothetical protein